MKTIALRLLFLVSLILLNLPLPAQVETAPFFQPGSASQDVVSPNSPLVEIDNADWTGTDALGRTLPPYAETGHPKADRRVGIFFFQANTGSRMKREYNMTEFLKTHPNFHGFDANPPGENIYWAEPIWGYYDSEDPWVIRKQLILLADAGLDFLFTDCTNDSIHPKALTTLLNTAKALQNQGVRVPKVLFFLNTGYESKIEQLYAKFYANPAYASLWFRWQGKPLLLSPRLTTSGRLKDPALLPTLQNTFTYRPTWALFDPKGDPHKWRFMDHSPVHPALGPDGKVEETVVSKSIGGPLWDAPQNGGVSSTPGHIPVLNAQYLSAENPRGLYFQEQWNEAEKTAAPILLVTGWNEWTAGVWHQAGVVMLGRKTTTEGHIVDEFNMDFNRDLEPMKGGYEDNYYMQLVQNVRRYKGLRSPPAASPAVTLAMDGNMDSWRGLQPVYRHAVSVPGTKERDFRGNPPGTHYTNNSTRNEVSEAQVAHNAHLVFFRAHTAEPLTPPAGDNWMVLLLDIDSDARTGWHGYDFRINCERRQGTRAGELETSVERWDAGRGHWTPVGWAHLYATQSDVELAVPRALLGFGKRAVSFDFKWTDNLPVEPDVMDFYTQGSVAPDGRFNYRYVSAETTGTRP